MFLRRRHWYELFHGGGWGLDAGVMWFVGVLLIFSLGYAAWVWWQGPRSGRPVQGQVTLGGLLLLALVVTVTTFLVRLAQRHLDRPLRWIGPAVSRSAYGAFILQGLPLIGLAVALRPLPLPAEAKALVVACGGVALSFALAWLLISRVPALGRVL